MKRQTQCFYTVPPRIACRANVLSVLFATKNSLLIAIAENLPVQLAEMISLLPERGVITAKNDIQYAVEFLTTRNALQPLPQKLVSLRKACRNLRVVFRAA